MSTEGCEVTDTGTQVDCPLRTYKWPGGRCRGALQGGVPNHAQTPKGAKQIAGIVRDVCNRSGGPLPAPESVQPPSAPQSPTPRGRGRPKG